MQKCSYFLFFDTQSPITRLGIYRVVEFVVVKTAFINCLGLNQEETH